MRTPVVLFFCAVLSVANVVQTHEGHTNRSVLRVTLPSETATLFYVERAYFTVRLKTASASVEAQRMYIGDGKLALDLVAHGTDGIFLQGVKYRQGETFKKGSVIRVRPGYKQVRELKAGDVYVTLPGVSFELPKETRETSK